MARQFRWWVASKLFLWAAMTVPNDASDRTVQAIIELALAMKEEP